DDEQARLASTIQASGVALMRIVNDILDLSKLEAGKLQLEQNDFDLRDVLEQVRSLLDPAAAQKGLSLAIRVPAELDTRVRGDAMRLQQVLNNLIGNAIKFTQRGGIRVTLAAADAAGDGLLSYRLSVADTGIGIEPDALARVFDPFEQADNATSRRYGGTGLGLAIVKRLVKEFGGDVSVESAVGRGSTFAFTCCLAKPEASSLLTPDTSPRADLQLENRRVLLVEDNPVNQLYAQAILDRHSCDTTIADNGLIAVECWRSSSFDLILMDCHMPEMDGFESARAIRAEEQSGGTRRTPIIGITASALPADRDACLDAGMDDVLVKPFGPQEFVDMMGRWCNRLPGSESKPASNDPAREPPSVRTVPAVAPAAIIAPSRKHDLLGVLLGFQQLGRRFIDGEIGTSDFLFETCRRIAQALACHDVVIWTFSEVDHRPALCPLARYESQSDTLIDDNRPRLGLGADWRRLIEDGYQLPDKQPQPDQAPEIEPGAMLEVTYAVNAEPLGVLACGRHVHGAWTHEQVQLLRRIASRIGVALLRAVDSAMVSARHSIHPQALDQHPAG
ncbi:MAG TPA: ATP-binding protein, partial [Burkholderiaceae bacterium]